MYGIGGDRKGIAAADWEVGYSLGMKFMSHQDRATGPTMARNAVTPRRDWAKWPLMGAPG